MSETPPKTPTKNEGAPATENNKLEDTSTEDDVTETDQTQPSSIMTPTALTTADDAQTATTTASSTEAASAHSPHPPVAPTKLLDRNDTASAASSDVAIQKQESKDTESNDDDDDEAYDEYTTDWESSRQGTSAAGSGEDEMRSFHRDGMSADDGSTLATVPTLQDNTTVLGSVGGDNFSELGGDGSSAFLLPQPAAVGLSIHQPPPAPPSDMGTPQTHRSHHSSSTLEMSGSLSHSVRRATLVLPKSASLVSRQGSEAMESFTIDKLRFDNLTHLYGRQTQQRLLRDLLLETIENSRLSENAEDEDDEDEEEDDMDEKQEETAEEETTKKGEKAKEKEDSKKKTDTTTSADKKNTAHKRNLVLIKGPAGCGKSVLAQTLSQTVLRQHGFFLMGKFDQQQKLDANGEGGAPVPPPQPYQAMAAACQQLVDDLTMQYYEESGDPRGGEAWSNSRRSTTSISTHSMSTVATADGSVAQRFAEEFQNVFDNEQDLALLYSIVPGLPGLLSLLLTDEDDEDVTLLHQNRDAGRSIAGSSGSRGSITTKSERSMSLYQVDVEQVKDMSFSEAKIRFLNAMTRFVRFLSSLGPLTIVLDDLQWADQPSLELLEAIATDATDNDPNNASSDASSTGKKTKNTESVTSEGEDKAPQPPTKEEKEAKAKKRNKSGGAVMILGLYRDNEVEEGHILRHTLRDVEEFANKPDSPLLVTEMPLPNLTKEEMGRMLSDLLLCTAEQVEGLAELVCQKTDGNAFFARQFLLMLQQQNLLQFQYGQMMWTYDLEVVRVESSSTDNVVDLLKLKLQKLPKSLQLILPRVACLGNRFLATMFELVTAEYKEQVEEADLKRQEEEDDAREKESSQPSSPDHQDSNDDDASPGKRKKKRKKRTLLQICQKEGLIVDCGQGWCKWEHDRIQEAALASVEDEKELQEVQYAVGSLLLEKLPRHEVSKALYVVTNLLNAGVDFVLSKGDDARCLVLTKLNLRAGKAAFASSAFSGAAAYLKTGIRLLPEDKWERPEIERLVLDLYSTTAEVQFCLGDDADLLKEYCEEILSLESLPLMSKRRVYNVKVHSLGAEGRSSDAKDLVVEILRQLDCRFPKRAQPLHAAAGITKLRMTIKKTTERLNDLPVTTDEKANWVFFLLDRLVTYTFQCDANLLPLAMLKGHRWTVLYGTSTYSSTLLCSIALMLTASLGDFEGGRLYAERALQLMTRTVEARTLFIAWYFVLHWVTPIENCKKPLLRGYQVGLQSGDLESSFWCVFCYIELIFYQGGSLQKLMDDCRIYCQQMEKYGQAMHLLHTKFLWQLFSNLADPSERKGKHILTGDIMNEEEVMRQITEAKDMHSVFVLNRYRICSAFWFGQYERAVELIEETEAQGPKFFYEKITPGFCGIGPFYCYCALSCIIVANRSKSNRLRQKYKKYALGFFKKIRAWVKKGNPNFRHIEAFMEAELAALDGQIGVASKQYEIAILLAGRRGLTGDQALTHHRYGDFLVKKDGGETDDSRYQYQTADSLYVDWGAVSLLKSLPDSANDFSVPLKEIDMGDAVLAEPSMLGLDASARRGY